MRNPFLGKEISRFSISFLLAVALAALAGCGAGSGGTAASVGGATTSGQTITGTVASGAPLAGATVTIKDNAGKTTTGPTAADGTFSISVAGMTPPFMLAATKGQQNMYSILPAMDMAAANTQNVNITPVTTLVMYELNGGADLVTMYTSGSFGMVTPANVSAKETIVRSKLPANTVNPIFSMMYGKFVASVTVGTAVNADPYDKALDGIGNITSITPASVIFSSAFAYTTGAGAALAPSIALTLTDTIAPYAARTSIDSSTPALVTATVKDATGAVVPNAVVTFTISSGSKPDTFLNGDNTALTNASGVATVTLVTSNTAGGASTVTASTTVKSIPVTNSLNYAVMSSPYTLSALTVPAAALTASGTASISVNVLSNGVLYTAAPMTVSFSSPCALAGKATLSQYVNTVNGRATAFYTDNGCSPGDVITATLPNGVTMTGNLVISAPFTPPVITPAPTITLTLTDPVTSAARTSIDSSSPARVTATVKDASGAAIPNVIVNFSTSNPHDTLSGGANTALTNASGMATVTLTTSNTAGGASTVTASSTVNGTAVTNSLNYAVGSSTLTLSVLTLPALTGAYGTAGVSVDVLNTTNGVTAKYTTPMTVSFTSACAATGKATLTPSVTTVNGTATANYLDNGCNNTSPGDTITATLSNGVTATGNLAVSSPAIGSIQFVSVVVNLPEGVQQPVPPTITLKGTGGTNRSESARVTFRVVDSAGNPLGNAPVTFSLNTALGGLTLSATTAPSDPVTGYVTTYVQAGTMSTAVRVTATTGALSTQSDKLVISTGIPAQDAFSLSVSAHNIEAWAVDGATTTLTARLADHFHNPVPDGTAVYFTSEGGSIAPSCTTVGGVCSVVWTSQNPRPIDGRSTILATAIGEEAFTDLNSNGVADPGEMIDINNISTDMGEAYVDYNENGIRDAATEPYIDFNGDGVYTGTTNGTGGVGGTATGDGKYNGVLCNATATPAFCSTQKSIDVRGSQVIIFSTSQASISTVPAVPIVLSSCTTVAGATQNTPSTVTVTVVDTNGNAMPAGTTVAFSTNNGTKPTPASWTVPDTIGCRTGFAGCPASAASPTFGDISVSLVSDAVYTPAITGAAATCTNLQSGGIFTVTVTSPKGSITTYTMDITD